MLWRRGPVYPQLVVDGRLHRVARILEGLRPCFEDHAQQCGDRVLAIGLSDDDWEELQIAEIWGLPVLASEMVRSGRLVLLCEANGTLIPPHHTLKDLQDIWSYQLQSPSVGGPAR